jgi:D-3-phosphoglycerate dehydrogenase
MSKLRRILLGPSSFGALDSSPRSVLVDAGFELVENPFRRRLTRDELGALLDSSVVGLIAGLEPLDRDVLQASSLRVVSRCGAGMFNVDVLAAEELAIRVCSTPDGPTVAVAELTLSAMLSILRGTHRMDAAMHAGDWPKTIGGQLEGRTVVVVGLGRIGRRVAQLVAAFGARIIAVDPMAAASADGECEFRSLQDALPDAGVVTLHCSGETEVLGAAELAQLPRGAFVLNCARGGVVNEAALLSALDSGHVAGAWLDCFVEEPYTGPLRGHAQVLLTPHVGSYTRECRLKMETQAARNLVEAFARAPCP